MSENITKYNLEYKGVLCTGVQWGYGKFFFTKDGKEYEFDQTKYIQCVADTDCIRCVIEEQFLPWLKDERIKELKAENAALRERLGKAIELPVPLETPILKVWKNRVPEDDTRMSFVDMWETTTVNFKLEHFPLWGKFYFPNTEEGKKAALARLAELKGEER